MTSRGILTRPQWTRGLPGRPEDLIARLGRRRYPVMARLGDRTIVAADPVEIVTGRQVWDVLHRITFATDTPHEGWWCGLLSYDVAASIEVLPRPRPDPDGPPRAWCARYETVAEYGHDGVVVRSINPRCKGFGPVDRVPPDHVATPNTRWTSSLPPNDYQERVHQIRALIRAGECYQVNLVQRLEADAPKSPWGFARALWDAAGTPELRAAILLDEGLVVSASPERLAHVKDGIVRSQPIKGTIDAGRFDALVLNAKDRAEHVMIVDLIRNDIGRIATMGSVEVPELMAPLHTRYVDHMVSTVRAHVADGSTAADLARALFPGGSVTGCPKVRAMEIIRDLEPVSRGPAFGSILATGPEGEVDMSILIRTAWIAGGTVRYWCGGAVTWDSDPAAEHAEAMAKAAPFLETITS